MMQSQDSSPQIPENSAQIDLSKVSSPQLNLNSPKLNRPLLAENFVIMFGGPGAGKGTQGELLAKALNVPAISTGQILRQAVADGTPLGLQVKDIIAKGHLVADDLMIELVRERLNRADCLNGCILDGFPRTVGQAQALDQILADLGVSRPRVIELVVPDNVLIDRIVQRGQSGSGRADDTAEIAKDRIEKYHRETAPVSGYYEQKGFLTKIDGNHPIDEVQRSLLGTFAGE